MIGFGIVSIVWFMLITYLSIGDNTMHLQPKTSFQRDCLRFLLEEENKKENYKLGQIQYKLVKVIRTKAGDAVVCCLKYNGESDRCRFNKYLSMVSVYD